MFCAEYGSPFTAQLLECMAADIEADGPVAALVREFGPRASEAKQQRYFRELFAWTDMMNITTFFFAAFDEDWKGNPGDPLGAEKHWGIFTGDRQPKQVMQPGPIRDGS